MQCAVAQSLITTHLASGEGGRAREPGPAVDVSTLLHGSANLMHGIEADGQGPDVFLSEHELDRLLDRHTPMPVQD